MATSIDVGDHWMANGPVSTEPCGLFGGSGEGKTKPIAMRTRNVRARVFAEHGFCEITEELTFLCDEDCVARFVFPLPPRSAVYRFKATIGDREVVTEVKRKHTAQEEYDSAVSQGHSAVHMKQQPGLGLYCVEIGNLSAMEEAVVTFSYVRLLNSVAGAIEFEHQATWVPPYIPPEHMDAETGKPAKDVAQANPSFAADVTYRLSYDVVVVSSRGFVSIESPSDGLVVTEESASERVVRLEESVADASRDFTLLIELPKVVASEERQGSLLLQTVQRGGQAKTVGLATFLPRLQTEAPPDAPPPRQQIVLVVDGSGSMGGAPIEQAREAALFLVKDLPAAGANVEFNVAIFGSSYKLMWPKCREYNDSTQREAVDWLQSNVHANWGGTQIHSVLSAVYEKLPLPTGATRQVVFLTDGGVSHHEEAKITGLVTGKDGSKAAKQAAAHTTVFSLGIGHGVHRPLVESVARATGGVSQFVIDGENIGAKAALLKRAALAAPGGCLVQPKLAFRACLGRNVAPNVLPPRLYPGEPLHVLLELPKADKGASLCLSASTSGQALGAGRVEMELPMDGAQSIDGNAIAVLHAMASIGCLMAGTSSLHVKPDGTPLATRPTAARIEDAVVELAVQEGLVTPHTSAVGVLLQRDPLDPDSVARVDVPLALPAGRSLWRSQAQPQEALCFGAGGGGRGGGAMMKRRAAPMMCAKAMCAAPPPAPVMACPAPAGGPPASLQQVQHQREVLTAGDVRRFSDCREEAAPPKRKGGGGLFGVLGGAVSRAAAATFGAGSPGGGGAAATVVTSAVAPPAPRASAAPDDLMLDCCAAGASCEEAEAGTCSSDDEDMGLALFDHDDDLVDAARLADKSEKSKEETKMKKLKDKCNAAGRDSNMADGEAASPATAARTPLEVLSLLNLCRTVEGSVPATSEVLDALAGEAWAARPGGKLLREASDALRVGTPARPSGLADDDAWATLLALAFLRKHLGPDRATWEGLEAKALEWLAGVWAQHGIAKSVGSVILAAMKLV